MTIAELSEATGKSRATVFRRLDELSESGRIERMGSRKSGYWKVL